MILVKKSLTESVTLKLEVGYGRKTDCCEKNAGLYTRPST